MQLGTKIGSGSESTNYTRFSRILHIWPAKIVIVVPEREKCSTVMSKQANHSTYHIYLLTVWQEPAQDQQDLTYRFHLADSQNGQHYIFATADELLRVLQQGDQVVLAEEAR